MEWKQRKVHANTMNQKIRWGIPPLKPRPIHRRKLSLFAEVLSSLKTLYIRKSISKVKCKQFFHLFKRFQGTREASTKA